jgi:hypothetical protein
VRVVHTIHSTQGAIGAFDTLYYHEWRARLPARARQAASELANGPIRQRRAVGETIDERFGG